MSQFVNYLRSIASNKKTLEGLIIIVITIVIWVVYNNLVATGKNPGVVYVAKKALYPGSIITSDSIGRANVSKKYLSKLETVKQGDYAKIISGDYCVKDGYSIPKNGLVYLDAITSENCNNLYEDEDFDGTYYIYHLSVDNTTSYGNSILPGSYIDLYLRINANSPAKNSRMVFQNFIKHIKVYKVMNKGKDVFAQDPYNTPTHLWFKVGKEDWEVLKSIEKLSGYGFKLVPIPRGASYSEKFQNEGENIKSEYYDRLKQYIDSVSIMSSDYSYTVDE